MSTTAVTVADLRPIDLFDDLDDAGVEEFAAVADWRSAEAGEVVVELGTDATGVLCLVEGSLRVFTQDGDRLEPSGHQDAPTWIAAISTLAETEMGVRMVAITDARWALIPADDFRRLALSHPSVHRRVMRQVRPLMTRLTSMQSNRERLAALGTMAAGLAHELNNPAAAAQRSASDLAEALTVIGATLREFTEAGIEREDAARIADLREQALQSCSQRDPLSALDAADAEEQMEQRLEALGVPDVVRVAEPLAAAGVGPEWLEEIHELAGPATPSALRYVAASLSAQRLVSDLREATDRMSSLISAVKAYAYMDRGGVVQADVHEGLETTLKVLGYKLKHTRIQIEREYDRSLPKITIYGSELNQVWTNLIDNAIDALGESGTITLRTRRDGDNIVVEIADTGPGIPEDVRPHVYEPFFTTKDVGKGTGLGLDTARRIVVERHGGSLDFDTSEHGTTFHVWLPLK